MWRKKNRRNSNSMIFIGMRKILITERKAKELAKRLLEEGSGIKPFVRKKLNLLITNSKSKPTYGKKNL